MEDLSRYKLQDKLLTMNSQDEKRKFLRSQYKKYLENKDVNSNKEDGHTDDTSY